MYLDQLRHVILEIGHRFGLREFHVIGSAAILASLPSPPEGALTATRDVDVVAPGDDEALADRMSFVMGEGSEFEIEHGYYVQGVTSRTPTFAPADWMSRAIPVRVHEYAARCMELHDLVISKLGAGREKDFDFARSVARLNLLDHSVLQARLVEVQCSDDMRRLMATRIEALFK